MKFFPCIIEIELILKSYYFSFDFLYNVVYLKHHLITNIYGCTGRKFTEIRSQVELSKCDEETKEENANT